MAIGHTGRVNMKGHAYVNWFTNKGLLYPVGENGVQQDQLQELVRNKAETRKGWVKCKVTDILCQSGKFWNPNSRPTGS